MVMYKTILDVIEVEIEKCNDGTSFKGALTDSLNKWADKNRGADHEIMVFYDEEGNQIFEVDNNNRDMVELSDEDFERIFNEEGHSNLNLNHNHPDLYEDGIPTYFSTTDRDLILVKNDNGNYCFRSMSVETPNGYRVTLIKNKDFSDDDIPYYDYSFEAYNLECKEYHQSYKDIRNDYAKGRIKECREKGIKISGDELREEATEYAIKKLGTMPQYLRERGIFDNFKNANCKLRFVENKL